MRRRAGAALLAAVLLAATACNSTNDPGDKDTPLQTRRKADVETLARQQLEAVAQLADGTLSGWQSRTGPCEGPNGDFADDGRWNLSVFAAVKLPSEKHLTGLLAVHNSWTAQHWQIVEYRTLPDGVSGTLSGRDPASGNSISLVSSDPPIQLAVNLGSACYLPADGEEPANA